MKIALVGPGAIGCLLGGLLSRAGHEIWLIDRHPERAKLLSRRGVLVSGVSGEFRAKVRATTSPQDAGRAELVMVTVKSFDTPAAARAAKPLMGADTAVLTLQNGLGNLEVLQQELGKDPVLGGVTALGASLVAPGQVHHAGEGPTVIGHPTGEMSDRLIVLKETFSEAGFYTEISTDLTSVLWGKLATNAGLNAVATLAQVRNGGVMESPALRKLLAAAVGEASEAARARGVRLPYPDMVAHTEEICQRTANNVNSMLQDVFRRRPTEVDAINGAVVREGQAAGVPTPTNQLLLSLIHGIEETYSSRLAR